MASLAHTHALVESDLDKEANVVPVEGYEHPDRHGDQVSREQSEVRVVLAGPAEGKVLLQ